MRSSILLARKEPASPSLQFNSNKATLSIDRLLLVQISQINPYERIILLDQLVCVSCSYFVRLCGVIP
jgi:hypothetical protein